MTHGYVFADFHARIVGKVNHYAVLQIRVFTELDCVDVGAQNAPGPNAGVLGYADVADEDGVFADIGGLVY